VSQIGQLYAGHLMQMSRFSIRIARVEIADKGQNFSYDVPYHSTDEPYSCHHLWSYVTNNDDVHIITTSVFHSTYDLLHTSQKDIYGRMEISSI